MSQPKRLHDRSPAEILAAIDAADADLSYDELLELEDFVTRIGGLANARMAIEMLERMDDAA